MDKQVVVITGANNGIGLGITKTLLARQFYVAALDLSGENLAELSVGQADRLRFYDCDVTDRDKVRSTVDAVVQEWGQVDILVNDACLAIFSPFEQKSLADTHKEFEVNYFGYIHLIQAVLPHMKAQGHGIIHNFSSGVGLTGFPGIYGYASTKGAIEALTRTLAIEFEPYGITVNLIHPPLTQTKSSAPLGIPGQMMGDPQMVGRKIGQKIGSTKAVITPDLGTALGIFTNRHFPGAMGRLFASMTKRALNNRPA